MSWWCSLGSVPPRFAAQTLPWARSTRSYTAFRHWAGTSHFDMHSPPHTGAQAFRVGGTGSLQCRRIGSVADRSSRVGWCRVGLQSRVLCVQAWAKASLGAHLRAAEAVNQRLKAVAYVLQVSQHTYGTSQYVDLRVVGVLQASCVPTLDVTQGVGG